MKTNDYDNKPIGIGDTIVGIENGWRGQVVAMSGEGRDLMLECLGINWWTSELDDDDRQWYSPFDVRRGKRHDPAADPSTTNFL